MTHIRQTPAMPDAPDAAGDDARVEAIARAWYETQQFFYETYDALHEEKKWRIRDYAKHIIAADPATSRIRALEEKNRALVEALEYCAEHLELALNRLGCSTESSVDGRSDADDFGGITALRDAREAISKSKENP